MPVKIVRFAVRKNRKEEKNPGFPPRKPGIRCPSAAAIGS
jgi:hypothetical protein